MRDLQACGDRRAGALHDRALIRSIILADCRPQDLSRYRDAGSILLLLRTISFSTSSSGSYAKLPTTRKVRAIQDDLVPDFDESKIIGYLCDAVRMETGCRGSSSLKARS